MRDGFLRHRAAYEATEEHGPDKDHFVRADMALTKRIAGVIEQHYAGHPWHIQVSHEQGIAKIQIPHLMGAVNWYVIPLTLLKSDPTLRLVVRAGGEILERYRIPRQPFGRDDFLKALSSIPIGRRSHGFVPH